MTDLKKVVRSVLGLAVLCNCVSVTHAATVAPSNVLFISTEQYLSGQRGRQWKLLRDFGFGVTIEVQLDDVAVTNKKQMVPLLRLNRR